MNRNLHSPTKLTEFARDFDIEPDTFFAKFVNKITNVYNSGYNTVNVVPSRQNLFRRCDNAFYKLLFVCLSSWILILSRILFLLILSSSSSFENISPSHSKDNSPSPLNQQSNNIQSPSTSKHDECETIDDLQILNQPISRTPSSVLQRISNLMAIRNNVSNSIVLSL